MAAEAEASPPTTQQYVRTILAAQYRTTPTEFDSKGLSEPEQDEVKFFFDFEQQVLRASSSMTTCEANGHAKAQAKEQLQDMYESSLRKYPMASSLNKEHFKLAMSMLNDENASFEVVKRFCDNISHLKSMGFTEDKICGALLMHNGDVTSAIQTCLDG